MSRLLYPSTRMVVLRMLRTCLSSGSMMEPSLTQAPALRLYLKTTSPEDTLEPRSGRFLLGEGVSPRRGPWHGSGNIREQRPGQTPRRNAWTGRMEIATAGLRRRFVMKARNLLLLAVLAAAGWSGVVHAQPLYPTDEGSVNPRPYDNGDYDNQDPYDDDQSPYYDDQGPDGSYDNPDPNYDSGYDPGYYDQGSYNNQGQVDVSIFYSNLHPYGRWIQRASYGWVWEPTRVRVGWQPYTVGRWVNTEYGWTWVSDEPWGW